MVKRFQEVAETKGGGFAIAPSAEDDSVLCTVWDEGVSDLIYQLLSHARACAKPIRSEFNEVLDRYDMVCPETSKCGVA